MKFRFAIFAALFLSGAPLLAQEVRPIEPVQIPPSVEQGLDLIYIDPELEPGARKRDELLKELAITDAADSPVDLFLPVSPIFTELRRGLVRYRMEWGNLPQDQLAEDVPVKPGSRGSPVAALRKRLGLATGDQYDAALAKAVKRYQLVHGLKPDGIAGKGTIQSLNLGAEHYEQLIMLNLERARRLPTSSDTSRYILVDAGEARIHLYEDGRPQDSMKAIVGSADTPTPMMAALMRYASVNPYWNVPPDLVQKLIAPRVVSDGINYLVERDYEILSDWSDNATLVDPLALDWASLVDKPSHLRFRRRPGPFNSMGQIKFMMPNAFGIYLHDTPDKTLFDKDDRWISNGCVRVEDARRLATWLFGSMPAGSDPKVEENVNLASPVPVYITYLTVEASSDGVIFRPDPYQRDAALVARLFKADVEQAGSI